jgi:hypothetical protein
MRRWFSAPLTLVALTCALAAAPVAIADLQIGGNTVTADTAATAYPSQPGVTYNGTLNTDTATYHDLDYLALTANAGETIEFTFQNTTVGSNPSFPLTCDNYCEEFLSLDKPNPAYPPPPDALGLCDGAGTRATYGDTEIFDWTFGAAGTYYMIIEDDGDLPLSYSVSYRIVSASGGTDSCLPSGTTGGGTGTGSGCKHHCTTGSGHGSKTSPPPPLVRFVRVVPTQRGTTVKATLTLGQWAKSVRIQLLLRQRTIASIRRAPLGPGRHKFKLVLPGKYQRMLAARHKLSLVVRFTVHGKSGATKTITRRLTLSS